MKQIKIKNSFPFGDETIESLNDTQMSQIEGGMVSCLVGNCPVHPSDTITNDTIRKDLYRAYLIMHETVSSIFSRFENLNF